MTSQATGPGGPWRWEIFRFGYTALQLLRAAKSIRSEQADKVQAGGRAAGA